MNISVFRRLKALFDELIDLSDAERERRIATATDLTESDRSQLRALLDAEKNLAGTTARPAIGSAGAMQRAEEWIGERVGPFVIDRELGRGGMGSVFLAHRVDGVEQRVAIKLIRPEQVDENTLARFRLERQVLALLQHPNIASLVDVGELDDGTPFVAMEYVEGEPITAYVRRHALDLHARLSLFIEVCRAVGYAHRNMVVHRDLKPGNILVDAEGRPKLLDFGIAKPLIGRLGTQDVRETSAAERFFSPQNAAPEQLRGGLISAATDVYGLGVLLYELLTNSLPRDFAGMTPSEVEHFVLEVEPDRPSSRVAGADARLLEGDLDAIVLKALRKKPEERYATSEQLAGDIENFLEGWPVEARKGRAWYRLRKFVGRHRVALGAASAFVALLAIAGILIWIQATEAMRQRDRAVDATNFLVETFRAADPEKALGEKLTAKQILDQAERSLTNDVTAKPALRAELLARIAEVKMHLGASKEVMPLIVQALGLLGKEVRPDSNVVARLIGLQAHTASVLGQYELAASVLHDAEKLDIDARMRAALESDTIDVLYAQGATDALQLHLDRASNELAPQLALDDSERWALLLKVAGAQEVLKGPEPSIHLLEEMLRSGSGNMGRANLLKAKMMLAGMYDDAHRSKDAAALMESVRQPLIDLYGRDSTALASWANQMANVAQSDGEYQRALSLYAEAAATYAVLLGTKSTHAANLKFNMAGAAEGGELWEQAEENYRESIRLAAEILPDTNENIEMFRTAYALFLNKRNRFDEAERVFATVITRAARDPKFRDDDVFKAAALGRSLARYAHSRTDENRAEFSRLFALPSDASDDLKRIAADQLKLAQVLGLSPTGKID